MASLIMYGIIAAVVLGGFWAVVHTHDNGVRAKEAAIWKPQLEASQQATKTAVDANASLMVDVKRIAGERQLCSDGVKTLGEASAAAEAQKARDLAAAGKKINALQTERGMLESLLALPVAQEENCDAKLSKVDAHLDAAGARRLRDHGPAGSSQPSGNAPADKGASPGSLRLTR